MTQSLHPHTTGGQFAEYVHWARMAAALLALDDGTLSRLGVTRAHVRALARRLTD